MSCEILLGGPVKATPDGLVTEAITAKAVLVSSTPYAVAADDWFIAVDASAGAVTINLPAAAGLEGRMLHVKKIDGTANNVIIDGSGTETLDDGLTATIKKQYESVHLICDGTEWWII